MLLLQHLKASNAVLLIDGPVALLLHPVLEDHGDAEDQDEVDTNNAEGCGEDLIKVFVGERREGTNASTFLSCNKSVRASGVQHERRRSSVDISAAVELESVSSHFYSTYSSVGPTFCCNKDWICGVSRPQSTLRFRRVCNVSTQMATPKPNVKVAQTTTSQP